MLRDLSLVEKTAAHRRAQFVDAAGKVLGLVLAPAAGARPRAQEGEAGGRGSGPEADRADAEDIYSTLEQKIVSLYYDRDESLIPRGWVKLMKESIRSVAPTYGASRMVKDYVNQLYAPSAMKVAVAAR